jgi:hypothetical protein
MRAKTLNSIFTLLSGANLFCPFTQRAQSEEQMPQLFLTGAKIHWNFIISKAKNAESMLG